MSNTQHTPGPWTVEEYGDDDAPALVIHKDSESRVCFMATPGSNGDPAKIEADAHLIAAAPELLEALKVLLEEAENFSVSGVYFNEAGMNHKGPALAHAAIAKAEMLIAEQPL